MKYFKMLVIVTLMCVGLISDNEQIDRACLVALAAFALSSVLWAVLDIDDDDCD